MEEEDNTKQNHEYYVVRTSIGREDKFLDSLHKILSNKEDHGIYSLFRVEKIKGYVFAEVESLTKLIDVTRGVPNGKGVIRDLVDFKDLEKYFEKGAEQILVSERDIVEIIVGPFKGDRARVVRIVPGKEGVVVEPLNMAVPIPITMTIDDIRVLEHAEEKKENE